MDVDPRGHGGVRVPRHHPLGAVVHVPAIQVQGGEVYEQTQVIYTTLGCIYLQKVVTTQENGVVCTGFRVRTSTHGYLLLAECWNDGLMLSFSLSYSLLLLTSIPQLS